MAAPIWESDWFARALARFLSPDDATRLAVSALLARRCVLGRVLVDLDGELPPISARDLLVCASTHGDWDAVLMLHGRCRSTSQRRREPRRHRRLRDLLVEMEAASGKPVREALRSAMRLQRIHPVRLPSRVIDEAARRGELSEVVWLHSIVKYDALRTIESAACCGHVRVLQWLLDHADEAYEGLDGAPVLQSTIRVDDETLAARGILSWRDDRRRVAYAFVQGSGLLPVHREVSWSKGYPLMDWAAGEGDMALLTALNSHPVAKTSLTFMALPMAAQHGHQHVVEWLFREHFPTIEPGIARAMAAAAKRGDMDMLQWIYQHKGLRPGSLNVVLDAAAISRRLDVLQWAFQHCLEERIRPRFLLMSAAAAGDLALVQYLHEDEEYPVGVSALERAVAGGHLEVARWIYKQIPSISSPQSAILVSLAAKSTNFSVLKWVVEDLGLWSEQATDNAPWVPDGSAAVILDYLRSRDGDAFWIKLKRLSVIRLFRAGRFGAAEWILENCPGDEGSSITPADVVWLSQLGRRYSSSHDSVFVDTTCNPSLSSFAVQDYPADEVFELLLRYRPKICCALRNFPVWAIRRGKMRWLARLEEMRHPTLFKQSSFNVALTYSRKATMLLWLLKGMPNLQGVRVPAIRWAAQYSALNVVHFVIDSAKEDHSDLIKCVRVGMWAASKRGHTDVLQYLFNVASDTRLLCEADIQQLLSRTRHRPRLDL